MRITLYHTLRSVLYRKYILPQKRNAPERKESESKRRIIVSTPRIVFYRKCIAPQVYYTASEICTKYLTVLCDSRRGRPRVVIQISTAYVHSKTRRARPKAGDGVTERLDAKAKAG